ncbi:MAG: glycosyltransferase family 4 protein, partial [Gammaproteobacteria bacterium]|nr:glycosyltransferase family 4 protein [Gammaproteobacteria bacterium]
MHVARPGANLARWHWVERGDRPASRAPRILFVGGEFARKGGHDLLAWAEMRDGPDVEIDIVCWPGQLPHWVAELLGNPGPGERVSRALAPRLPNVRVHVGLQTN